MMTEREAWLYLADLWSEARPNCYGDCTDVPGGYFGLCGRIGSMLAQNQIGPVVFDRMCSRVEAAGARTGKYSGHYWPQDAAGAKARARFCKRQASALTRKSRKPAAKSAPKRKSARALAAK